MIKAKQRQKMEGVTEGDETAGDWNLEEAGHMREETKEKEEVYLQKNSLPKFYTFLGSLFDMLSGCFLCLCFCVRERALTFKGANKLDSKKAKGS